MTRSSKQLLERLKKARGHLRSRAGDAPEAVEPLATSKSADALFEKASSGAKPAPTSVLFVRSDSYGDLILFAPVLAELKRQWPRTRFGLILKARHQDVIPLLPSGIEYLTTDADPYRGKASEYPHSTALADAVRAFAPEVLVAPSYEKSWLHALAAASVPDARRISVGPAAFDANTVDHFTQAGLGDCSTLFPEVVTVDRAAHELDKGAHLVGHLCQTKVASLTPSIRVPEKTEAEAKAVLGRLGLKAGRFVVCNPAGSANVALKSWSPENFAAVVDWLENQEGVRVLLAAHTSEEATVQAVLSHSTTARKQPAVWLGSHGELALLAGILKSARAYVGNDTSTIHLAEALQVPVLGIYGGGTWPRFSPSLPRSIAVVHPLPCFGCGWDCHLVDAPCVKLVRPPDVIAHLPRLLAPANRHVDGERIVQLSRLPEDQLVTYQRSRERAVETERDRQARLAQVLVLTRELSARDRTIADLHRRQVDAARRTETASAESLAYQQKLDQLAEKLRATEVDSGNRLQQIKVLTAAVNTARDECTSLRQQLEATGGAQQIEKKLLEEQKRQVADALAAAKAAADGAGAQTDTLRRENEALRTQSSELTLKVRLLEEEIRNLKIEHGVVTSRAAYLEPMVESLRQENLAASDSHRQAAWKNEEQLRAITSERDHLRQQYADQQAKLADLNRQLTESQTELTARTTALAAATAKASQLLEAANSEKAALVARLSEVSSGLEQRTAENRDLTARVAAVSADLARVRQEQGAEREAGAAALRQKTEEAAKSAEAATRSQTQRAHLEAVLGRHAQELEGCRKEIARLHGLLSQATDTHEADLVARRNHDEAVAQLRALLATAEGALRASEERYISLQTALSNAEQACEAERNSRLSVEGQRDALQAALAAEEQSRAAENRARLSAEEQRDSLQSSLSAAKAETADLQSALAERVNQLAQEQAEFADQKERLLARVRQLEEVASDRDHQLELRAREAERLANRLSETTSSLENALSTVHDRGATIAELEASLSESLARLSETESQRAALEQALALGNAELSRAEAELLDAKRLIAVLRDEGADRDRALRNLAARAGNEAESHRQVQAGLREEIASLGAALAAKTADEANLSVRLQELEALMAARVLQLESTLAAVREQAEQQRSALERALTATRATLAEERTITRAHRRSAMLLAERIQGLVQGGSTRLS